MKDIYENLYNQKFSVMKEFYCCLEKNNIKFAELSSLGSNEIEPTCVKYAKEYYEKAKLRAEKRNLIDIVALYGDHEDYKWILEKLKEIPSYYFYFNYEEKRDVCPIDNVILVKEKNDEFRKFNYIMATAKTEISNEEFIIYFNSNIGLFLPSPQSNSEIKNLCWNFLKNRIPGCDGFISKLDASKDKEIYEFCHQILMNCKKEPQEYVRYCYCTVRDKNKKADLEFLYNFLKEEINNFPKDWLPQLKKDLVKLQKKLENNKSKQK